ncbi:Gfo/Idh/MocA family protein [Candidatus Palauibacter sp.]|uniref:Gfo/Idh/MocA family protein n=1 Tax=Candidatus Palauibacter sp. TaxID=3101350 RepID=UPI003B5B3E40
MSEEKREPGRASSTGRGSSTDRDRRSFVKSVAAGSVLAAGAPSLLAGAESGSRSGPAVRRTLEREPETRRPPPSDDIGLAVIGAGGMGMADVATALRIPGVNLVAACDVFDGRLEAARERHGEIFTSRDYREVLARDDVDAVIVGTPDHWHQPISVDALRAGKAVYCEKPMVHRIEEGHDLIRAEQESGSVFQVGSQGMSSLGNEKAKELYEEGAIGELNYAEGFWARNDPIGAWQYPIPAGASEETVDWKGFLGPAPDRPYDPLRIFRWRNYRDYGTGVAGDLFVHLFSSLHFVVSSRGPTRIQAAGGLRYWKDGREVPDVLLGVFDYPETATHPGFNLSLRVNFVDGTSGSTFLRLVGSEGAMDVTWTEVILRKNVAVDPMDAFSQEKLAEAAASGDGLPARVRMLPPAEVRYEVDRGYRGAHVDHFFNWFEAIRGGPPALEDAAFGLRAAAPALACNLSYFEDRIVRWDPDAMRLG